MSYFDDNEDRIVYGRSRHKEDQEPRDPTCRRCGSSAVRWRQQGGRWVLFSLRPGIEHSCDVTDDFDDLTKD